MMQTHFRLTPTRVNAPSRWGGVRWLLVLALWHGTAIGGARERPRFYVPSDDLPRIRVRGFDVTFMPNGSFVLSKDDVYLFDGGLGFSDSNWVRWGTQIRRSLDSDTYEISPDAAQMHFKSTVQDIKRRDSFRLEETVRVIRDGLRFEYLAWPVESMILATVGPVFHGPIAELGGLRCELWPGFVGATLPKAKGKMPRISPGRVLVLGRGTKREIEIRTYPPRRWMSFDERRWHLNTFRFEFSCPILAVPFTPENAVSFSFDLLLGPGRRPAWRLSSHCRAEATPWGGVVVYHGGLPLAFIAPQVRCVGSPQTFWLWDRATAQPAEGDAIVGRVADENIKQYILCRTKLSAEPTRLTIDYSLSAEGKAKLQYGFVLCNVLAKPFAAESVRAFGAKPPPKPEPEPPKDKASAPKPKELPGVAIAWAKAQPAEEIALGVGGPIELRTKVNQKTTWVTRQVKLSSVPAYQLRATMRLAKNRKSATARVVLRVLERPSPSQKEPR